MTNECLISVVVISYNSERFIEETLNSIRAQTYPNVELIISDDASVDNTVAIAEKWISDNSKRFVRSQIVSSGENQGIPGNLNRGIRAATGKYIKHIAADDILAPKCLETAYKFCERKGYDILFSNVSSFFETWEESEKESFAWDEKFFKKGIKEKIEILSSQNILFSPTAFYKKELIEKTGYFDETYRCMEDYPMWIKLLENGFDIAGENFVSVFYRMHQNSLSNPIRGERAINTRFYYDDKKFFEEKRLPVLRECKNYKRIRYMRVNYFFNDIIIFLGNRKNILVKGLLKVKQFVLRYLE